MKTTPAKKRRPLWRRMLIGTGITIGLVVLSLILIATFFNKQITRQVLDAASKNIETELQVGDASLSLLKGFPNASVNLSDVVIKDAFGDDLLKARELSFRFKLTSLFGGNIKVKDMHITGGGIRVRITARGKANYEIFKKSKGKAPSDTGSGSGGLSIALENAELENLLISYQNVKTEQIAELNLRSAGFAGSFSDQKFNLSSQAELTVSRLQMEESRYLLGEKVRYNAVVAVDLTKHIYDFQRMDLTVGGNTFNVEGVAVDKPSYTDLNFKLLSKEGDVSVVFDLLPEPYHSYFNDFQSSGTYDFKGFIVGRASKTKTPTVGVEVALRNGQLSSEKLQSPLRNVSFRAVYSAPPDGSGVFEIADFKGSFGGQPLNMHLKIKNLDDPIVDFQCNGALPMAAAFGLFDDPNVTDGDGIVRLKRLRINGRYADMLNMRRINNVRTSGEVQFEAASILYKSVPLRMQSGRIRVEDNLIVLDDLELLAGRSDIALRGNARNLLPVLFADSLNTTDALLEFTGKLYSKALDMTQLVEMLSVQEDEVDGGQTAVDSLRTAGNVERQRLTDKLKGVFELSIDNVEYNKIRAGNFFGRLAFDHNRLVIKGDTRTMQGQVKIDGLAHFAISPTLKLRITAQDIDLETCMDQCENFGQSVITDENLRGRLSGRVVVWAFWNERNDFLMDNLRAYADVTATRGKLLDLEMLQEFSTFAHIEDLRRVEFNQLQNYLEIRGQQLYIPVMFIQNNALNMTLSGTHTYNNDVDYKIKVNVGQTVLEKMKGHGNDFDPLPKQKGWFNAYYTIVGNLDIKNGYKMKRGKRVVKAAFERSEARKKQIAVAIDNEFSGVDTRPPRDNDDTEYLDEITGGQGRPGAVKEEQ